MQSILKIGVSSALLLGIMASHTASAFVLFSCNGNNIRWNGASTTVRAGSVSFPAGVWRTSLATAINRVNENPAAFDFNVVYNDTSVGFNNGQNEIWWSSGFGAPAIANLSWNCNTGRFTEGDIRFDNTVNYTTSMAKSTLLSYAGSNRAFENTAIHELGHVLGLDHTPNTYSIMGEDWDHTHANGSSTRSYLGEDAAAGAVTLYGGNPGNVQDLSVAHWRWTGTNAGYSTHDRTRIFTSGGGNVSFTTVNGEPRYNLNRGQSYQIEFSYENNGESFQTTNVGYYVSTNDYISTFDTLIGGRTGMGLGRNTVFTFRAPVTIPSNLTRGASYWLGVIIDNDNTLSEVTETNNRTYIPIRIN